MIKLQLKYELKFKDDNMMDFSIYSVKLCGVLCYIPSWRAGLGLLYS
jgi:hypothetical protein